MPRLFFALWPDEPVRNEIKNLLDSLPGDYGRKIPVENIHITLAFLGNADDQQCNMLQHYAKKIKSDPFKLILDHTGWWKKSQIIWLAPSSLPAELKFLAQTITKLSESCGFRVNNKEYKPHLTLMRKAQKKPGHEPEISPICWVPDNFVLVSSETRQSGAFYNIIERWNFHSN